MKEHEWLERGPKEFVYLRTRQLIGAYEINEDRVEISEFIKEFPELHERVRDHELSHAEIENTHKSFYHHIVLDLKNMIHCEVDPTLNKQIKEFNKKKRPRTKRLLFWMISYHFILLFLSVPLLAAFPILYIERKRRERKNEPGRERS